MRNILGKLGLLAVVGLSVASVAERARATDVSEQNSYPYDPTCSWGRVSDGKGMLVRCLSLAEAKVLASGKSAKEAAATTNASSPPSLDQDKLATKTPPASAASPAPDSPAPAPAPATEEAAESELSVEVDPVKADKGEFAGAKLAASSAKGRYLACIDKNGGISLPQAEVVLRFLVRERGRAEGVSVKSFKGLSKQAAKCVASVVDRRQIGDPEGPLVGASVRVAFSMQPKAAEKP